jgi:hypothetical protein
VSTPSQHGGQSCPTLVNEAECNTHECAKDCIFEWKPWSECSVSCGGGDQVRKLVIKQLAAHGGAACPSEQSRLCNTHTCPTPSPTAAPTKLPTHAPGTIPLIKITGLDVYTVDASHAGEYKDPGASCQDKLDGSLPVTTTGFVNLAKIGAYKVEYNCINARGFPARTMSRMVVVRHIGCPVCHIHGIKDMKVEASFPFADPGAVFIDEYDGNLKPLIVEGEVDVEKAGIYKITYRGKNTANIWNDNKLCKSAGPCVRTVEVTDTLKPVIHLQYGKTLLHKSAANDKGVNGEANPAAKFMAQATTSTGVTIAAAFGAFAMGVAFLAHGLRKQDNADLQQLV